MITFEDPQVLLLMLPFLVFWTTFMRLQRRALLWVTAHVGARFRDHFSRHTPRSLAWHGAVLLLLGLLLIVAGARPIYRGPGEAFAESGRVLLLIDASASMKAEDVAEHGELSEEKLQNRFEVARHLAGSLVRQLDGYRFALVTFSGLATFNLPMTDQQHLLGEALRTLEVHTFYQNTGSSLPSALDTVFHFAAEPGQERQDADLQVVLIGDGEPPKVELYDDVLNALADQEIPIHTLAVGSREGESRLIYDFRDVMAGKKGDDRTVLRSFTTRRVDEHLQRMSQRTDGLFAVASTAALDELIAAIRSRPQRVIHDEAGMDLSFWALLGFAVVFLGQAWLFGPRRPRDDAGFDVRRLGEPPRSDRPGASRRVVSKTTASALLLALPFGLASLSGCRGEGPAWRAHQENEQGIRQDQLGRHAAAVPHYERSLGFRIDAQIPTYNLARSHAESDHFSAAHELNQRALELDPFFVEAYFNDGVVLFRWGRSERDPGGCELERAVDFWRQAEERFRVARELADPAGDLAASAKANQDFLTQEIRQLEELIANPPAACQDQVSSSSSSSSSDSSPPPSQGSEPPPSPPGSEPPPPQGSSPPPPQGSEPPPPSGSEPPPPPPGSEPPGAPPQGGSSQDSGSSGGKPPEPENGGANDQAPLSEGERDEIRQALERIAGQRQVEGKYHRRSRLEQFPRDVWENPEAEIWW